MTALVFSRAKQINFFDGINHLDILDLLKTVSELVQGYEVDQVPLWQWEIAILEGYRVFRDLRDNNGGRIVLNVEQRELKYLAPYMDRP